MKAHMTESSGIRMATALAGLAWAAAASAQQPRVAQDLPQPGVGAESCADVNWDPELLEQYPRIGEACQEVVTAEGNRWARFEAELMRRNADGSVRLDFKDRNDRSIEELTLQPAPNQRVTIGGRTYSFAELERGQVLNLYVPEGVFAVSTEAGAPDEQLAQIVEEEPLQLAQAEPAAQPEPRELPRTAGPLPWVAAAGGLSLLGGLLLTIRRRFLR
jgi:hypothetical protein